MKKFIAICLAMLLAFAFVSCDATVKGPGLGGGLGPSIEDTNVPPAEEFLGEIDQEAKDLISTISSKIRYDEYEVSQVGESTITCLEGAISSKDGKALSGSVFMITNETSESSSMEMEGSFTIGDVTYSTDSLKGTMKAGSSMPSIEGELKCGSTILTGMNAYSKVVEFISGYNVLRSDILVTKYVDGDNFSGIKEEHQEIYTNTSKEQNETNKTFIEVQYNGHTYKEGNVKTYSKNESSTKFLYMSFDGKYYTEDVYNSIGFNM